jgi:hypothetical protein
LKANASDLANTNSNLAVKITSVSGTQLNIRLMATPLTFNAGVATIDLSAYLGGKNFIAFAVHAGAVYKSKGYKPKYVLCGNDYG